MYVCILFYNEVHNRKCSQKYTWEYIIESAAKIYMRVHNRKCSQKYTWEYIIESAAKNIINPLNHLSLVSLMYADQRKQNPPQWNITHF